MALPDYIPTRTVGFRSALEMEQGKALTARVVVKASESLRWGDDGKPLFEALGGTFTSARGEDVTFPLAITDSDGWLTTSNKIIDVSAEGAYTHLYTAAVTLLDARGDQVGDVYQYGPFVVPASESTLWLDELEEQSTVEGLVVARPTVFSVNGQDGAVTVTAAGVGAVPNTSEGRTTLAASAELSAAYVALGARTKTDTSAGVLDWLNNGASGYLLHLRTGADSGSGAAAVGIGTDLGSGNGLLVSHKNSGVGIFASGQPGAGRVAEFTSRGSGAGHWINVQAGAGAAQVNARDGAGFSDGVSTSGSTTFTSASAAFVAGDVGKVIAQLTSRGDTDPLGCIPGGTTIAAVVNSTTVTLSQAATATGTGVLFQVAGRMPALTQAIWRVMDTDLISPLVTITRGGTDFRATDAASIPVKITGKASQTARLLSVVNSSGTEIAAITSAGGLIAAGNSYLSNASLVGAVVQENTTYSSHPAIRVRGSGSTGNNLEAYGLGSSIASRINKDGYLMTRLNAAPADGDLVAGEVAIWFDSTNGAAKLKFKAKEAGGTVRTGEVALS